LRAIRHVRYHDIRQGRRFAAMRSAVFRQGRAAMKPASVPLSPAAKQGIFFALDTAAMTPSRYAAWALASGGTFLDGFSVASLGVALPLLTRDFAVSPLLVGLIGAALVLGAVVGASLGGPAADRFGRKPVFLIDMAVLALGSAIGAFAVGPWMLAAGQFVAGVGIGMDFPTSGSYVSEIMPVKRRARMVVATIALQSVGMVAAALAGAALLDALPRFTDWRLLLGLTGVLAILILIGRARLQESPRWLADKGRLAEAMAVLSAMGDLPPSGAGALPAITEPPRAADGAWLQLFSRPWRMRTLLASLPWFLMDIATYGVGLFTPVILGAMHIGALGGAGPIGADFGNATGSAVVDAFLFIGFVIGIVAVPRFGRIPMQVAGFAGMTLGMLLLVFATLAGDGAASHLVLVIGGFILFNLAMNAGPNATTFTLAPTLFPTAIRGQAAGFAAASAKVGATIGIFAVPQLQAAWGLVGVLVLMAGVSLAGLIATAALAHVVNEEGALEESA
jgi:MFS transporter, putative metabolite transport protein